MRGRFLAFIMGAVFLLTAVFSPEMPVLAQARDLQGAVETEYIQKFGNIFLPIKCSEIKDAGYSFGDVVTVSFLDKKLEIPFCRDYTDIEIGETGLFARDSDEYIMLAIYMKDFATTYGLATKVTGEAKSVVWNAAEGVAFPVNFTISMKTPGGYYDEYMLHQMSYSTERNDYPDLTDEEFANFREICAGGLGKGRLYRSSSPINPKYNRNAYADAAIRKAGVTVIMNLADDEAQAKSFDGFFNTYYADQKCIFLNMGVDFDAADFRDKLAQGLKFFAQNPGIYDIHCTEGRDRAGFVCAVIECLMEASYDEVLSDYMVSFYNYYGVKPGDDKYEYIVKNLSSNLCRAFGITDAANADLEAEAAEYVKSLGLTDEELNALKANLTGGELKLPAENRSEAAGTSYIVQPGDTLRKIAQKQLGDSERWTQIYELNRDSIRNPDLIFIGQELKVS